MSRNATPKETDVIGASVAWRPKQRLRKESIREFKIYDPRGKENVENVAHLISKNNSFARPSRAVSRSQQINLRRKMIKSEVFRRTWAHSGEF